MGEVSRPRDPRQPSVHRPSSVEQAAQGRDPHRCRGCSAWSRDEDALERHRDVGLVRAAGARAPHQRRGVRDCPNEVRSDQARPDGRRATVVATCSPACCTVASAVDACRASGTTASPTTAASFQTTIRSTRHVTRRASTCERTPSSRGSTPGSPRCSTRSTLTTRARSSLGADDFDPDTEERGAHYGSRSGPVTGGSSAIERSWTKARRSPRLRNGSPRSSESERQPRPSGRAVPGGKLTKSQARALVEALRDIVDVLAEADPEDKADLYAELGVSLTYHTDGRVAVEALPVWVQVRVGGGT